MEDNNLCPWGIVASRYGELKIGERIIYDMEVVFNFQWLYQVVIFSGKMNMVVQLKI